MEFSKGTDVDVDEDFVEIGDIELPDDQVQCGSEFCVICTELVRNSSPTFGPCLLWPNGWMDQDAIWYEGRPWRRPQC